MKSVKQSLFKNLGKRLSNSQIKPLKAKKKPLKSFIQKEYVYNFGHKNS